MWICKVLSKTAGGTVGSGSKKQSLRGKTSKRRFGDEGGILRNQEQPIVRLYKLPKHELKRDATEIDDCAPAARRVSERMSCTMRNDCVRHSRLFYISCDSSEASQHLGTQRNH